MSIDDRAILSKVRELEVLCKERGLTMESRHVGREILIFKDKRLWGKFHDSPHVTNGVPGFGVACAIEFVKRFPALAQ